MVIADSIGSLPSPSRAKQAVQPDLLHAQPTTVSRQSACLLPGPFRPLCRVKSQCYVFAARVSNTTTEHYILARSIEASRQYANIVAEMTPKRSRRPTRVKSTPREARVRSYSLKSIRFSDSAE